MIGNWQHISFWELMLHKGHQLATVFRAEKAAAYEMAIHCETCKKDLVTRKAKN